MPPKYLLLADGSITILLPSEPMTIHPHSVNYRQIKAHLSANLPLVELMPLINIPTPNGIFRAYVDGNRLFVSHIDTNYVVNSYNLRTASVGVVPTTATYLGSYTSEAELRQAHAEYLI